MIGDIKRTMEENKPFGKYEKWEVINNLRLKTKDLKTMQQIIDIILENRGIKTKKEKDAFLKPSHPKDISLADIGIQKKELDSLIDRLKKAYRNKEKIVIYGDYDADGICSTAIMWEALYNRGFDITPYIPERFSEGYGINSNSIKKLKKENKELKLVITVDNGIVAFDSIKTIQKLGIDVVVLDHHQREKKLPEACAVIHTDKICGVGISWFVAGEIRRIFKIRNLKFKISDGLELAAIGTVADQVPLTNTNRSFVKYGMEELKNTQRKGLVALYKLAGIENENLGTYEINYMIAPRLNAMGRLENAIDSLRLLCTQSYEKSIELAYKLNQTNSKRQKIVDDVVAHARLKAKTLSKNKIIILSDKSYHEGVIGLVASKLTEEYYRPSVVMSKGEIFSKASCRSISGFNIIDAIKKTGSLIEGGGGHPMAAGFTIANTNIKKFSKKLNVIANSKLTRDILSKKLKVDLKLELSALSIDLYKSIKQLEPFGMGNPAPVFVSTGARLLDVRGVGDGGKHLKMNFEKGSGKIDAIWFNAGKEILRLNPNNCYDIAYHIDENHWNGIDKLQLKIMDVRTAQN